MKSTDGADPGIVREVLALIYPNSSKTTFSISRVPKYAKPNHFEDIYRLVCGLFNRLLIFEVTFNAGLVRVDYLTLIWIRYN